MYITAAELLRRLGTPELCSIMNAWLNQPLNAEVFERVVRQQDTSGDDPNDIDIATEALERVEYDIQAAANIVNGYLVERYSLPLAESVISNSVLPEVMFYLVHYSLMLAPSEKVESDRKWAQRILSDIAAGKVALGQSDPTAAASSTLIRTGHGRSQFDWEAFGR